MTKKYPWPNLIWQPLIAILFVMLVLFFMGHFTHSDVLWAVGAGSLSSSCYIVFGKPFSVVAQPKMVVGGYLVGILTGLMLRVLVMQFQHIAYGFLGTPHFYIIGMLAAISVGFCLFFMALLKLEHPPAAGMALVLVIDMQDYNEIILVILAALLLVLLRRLLCNKLVDIV